MEYKIDRVIYGDGRIVYEVYHVDRSSRSDGYGRTWTQNTVVHSSWVALSLAKANRDYLQKTYLDNQVISRKEVL